MEQQDFWQVTKQYVVLFKDGVEIASGFICFSIFENQWEEEYEDHQREEDDSIMIYNGKEITDYDYDETTWDEERELFCSEDYDEVLDYYKDLIKDLRREDDDETINENGPNVVYEGNHGVYYKFNKVNGKIHGLKEMFCGDALLMTSNYSNGELDGIQTIYASKVFNEYEKVNSPIKIIEKYEKGKLLNSIEFWTDEKDSQGNYYAHIISNYKKDGKEEILLFTRCIFGEDKFGPIAIFSSPVRTFKNKTKTKEKKTEKNEKKQPKKTSRVNWDDTEDIGIVTHYKGKPFTGICYSLHENGKVQEECEMLKGLKEGKYKKFYEDGKLLQDGQHKNDKRNGVFITYNDEGLIEMEDTYKDDVFVEDDTTRIFFDFQSGNIDGDSIDSYKNLKEFECFFPNGNIMDKRSFKNGKLDGKWKRFYENGQIQVESNHKNGKYHGIVKSYYENGNLKHERNYNNDLVNGIMKDFYKNGQLKVESNYKNGKLDGKWKRFYENGHIHVETEWINGFQEGAAYSFYKNGDKMRESMISEGRYNGSQIEWWPNGSLKAERIFKNDELISEKNYKKKNVIRPLPEAEEKKKKESLNGKSIVISGVFEKYSRKELKTIIEKGGGKVSSSISKNTSFILAGDKMGPSKKEKAIKLNIEMIGEENFIKKYIN